MPTREERLAHAAQTTKAQMARLAQRQASIASAQREDARKARDRRRYQVGKWCDEAGVLTLDDGLLQDLFTLCRQIAGSATPRDTLQACQALVSGQPGMSVDGGAPAAQCVGPACQVG